MRNLYILLKVQLRNLFLRSGKQFSSKKKAVGFGAILVPALLFLYLSITYSFMLSISFENEYQYLVLYLMGFISLLMLVLFGFQSAGGHLFGFKDYELLMSLPVTRFEILTSKFLSFLLLQYFYSLFLILPAMGVVAYQLQPSLSYYLLGIITFLILPLVPMILVSILAYVAQYIVQNFKYKAIVQNIISFAFIGLILYGSLKIQNLINLNATSLNQLGEVLGKYLPFMTFLFDGMIFQRWDLFILGIFLNIGAFALFIVIFARYFMRLNGKIKQGITVENFQLTHSKKQSVLKALLKKEAKSYFSNSTYVMNTLVFPILAFMGCIYLIFIQDQIHAMPNLIKMTLFPFMIGIVLMASLTACTTNSSISLEGNRIYLLKSLPIKAKTIFDAKILLNCLVIIPLNTLSILLVSFVLHFTFFQTISLILILVLSAIFISYFGIILNLHYYRLDWESSVMVIKQSMPVFITLFLGLILSMIVMFMSRLWIHRANLLAIGVMIALGLLDGLLMAYLYSHAEKLLNQIN